MTSTEPSAPTTDAALPAGDRYVVISADCHAGASIRGYRPYLASRFHDDFDAWTQTFDNPYQDLEGDDAERNWDSARRLREMEDDGVVGEVVFPNTIPPFFPKVSLVNQAPPADAGDLERRWAGLQAHNRWLADFCAETPGRRAGIAQIMLHDVGAAVDEIHWAADTGLTGGILLPGAPPGSGLPPLYAPDYEPIWAACEERGMPVNHHSGSAAPEYGDYPEAMIMFILEVTWWAHRTLWHLLFAGVLERHPDLQLVFTEQGSEWVVDELARLDQYYLRFTTAKGSQEAAFAEGAIGQLSMAPSEYFARQCHLGSSFIRRHEVARRDAIGTDHIMWGSDFPHLEGCWPWSGQHLEMSFGGQCSPAEIQAMVGSNAARIYGFDLDALAPIAAEVGPTVDQLAAPLRRDDIPEEALRCPAFAVGKYRPDPDLD
ncbi:MAG: amidohydrolase family protein [Acidimicrobiales bacterium]|nr:amidohydrolase family protein [Acidimicrobiales bacterium]